MRVARVVGLAFLGAVILASCGWLGGLLGGETGLVVFYTNPTYNAGTQRVEFRAAIQFPDGGGRATEIEYQLLEGTEIVSAGSAQADEFDETVLSWKTGTVSVPVSQTAYSGSILTIFLDPEGVLSSDTGFTTEADRQKAVSIP